jgi:S1-C subfamily serine protease
MSGPTMTSGGPLLDQSGHVIGVIVAKLDAVRIVRMTGSLPENVNFAINAGLIRSFLDASGVRYHIEKSLVERTVADAAENARQYTFSVDCER